MEPVKVASTSRSGLSVLGTGIRMTLVFPRARNIACDMSKREGFGIA